MPQLSRRSFLKKAGAAVAAYTFFHPLRNVLASVPAVLPTWTELLEYARWSPSIHNLQPHRLKAVSATEALLYYDPARLLPVGDPDGVFATVALGVFIENLSIAARPHRCGVEVAEILAPVRTSASAPEPFARLRITPSADRAGDIDRALILARRTSRKGYDGRPVASAVLDAAAHEAARFGHRFHHASDEGLIAQLTELNQATLFSDLSTPPMRAELTPLFRYSKREAEKKADGLWSRCMGFPGAFMRSVFRHHQYWSTGLRKPAVDSLYGATFRGTATIGWFSGPFATPAHWLDAGRMMARAWLRFTAGGAYIHPFGSLITNEAGYQALTGMLPKSDGDGKLWMIFRTGYSPKPARSYRLPLDSLWIS